MDIIKNCFKKCVYTFNSNEFINSEEECINECIEQYKKRINICQNVKQKK
ncbi:unnamed protein product (macronuclear) [Paramecium tetraurelia]|uniref:Mitochondrial import inner membrane translocase subunit n=1 Tax=Paramecium tetraurelia TaxID=5888 RepID=A0E9H4_PARTE|nr:uncharacterized protein GSPATT00024672001 [Paramecium tetraurelia]CAK91941.1 unnamed protein product [Paramecium tetraurelia]|eukprot:XP_001459338.1 hypothetical protein (macronuclear) [Paramecium tetraurelia strain d4-2]